MEMRRVMKKIRKCAIMMAVMLGVLQLNMVAWAAEDEIPVVEQQMWSWQMAIIRSV